MSRLADTIQVGTATVTDTAAVISGMPGGAVDCFFQAQTGNARSIFWGDADSQPFELPIGATVGIAVNSPNTIYFKTASDTAIINWMVRK